MSSLRAVRGVPQEVPGGATCDGRAPRHCAKGAHRATGQQLQSPRGTASSPKDPSRKSWKAPGVRGGGLSEQVLQGKPEEDWRDDGRLHHPEDGGLSEGSASPPEDPSDEARTPLLVAKPGSFLHAKPALKLGCLGRRRRWNRHSGCTAGG